MMDPDAPPPAQDREIWFPAKRYGWGWGAPCAWQGWVVMILWLAVFALGAVFLSVRSWIAYGVFVVVMVAILIAICYAKGEKPHWRWGDKPADQNH